MRLPNIFFSFKFYTNKGVIFQSSEIRQNTYRESNSKRFTRILSKPLILEMFQIKVKISKRTLVNMVYMPDKKKYFVSGRLHCTFEAHLNKLFELMLLEFNDFHCNGLIYW